MNLKKNYFCNASEEFYKERLEYDRGFDIVLLKNKEEVLAVSYYNVSKLHSPFHKKETTVILFGQAVKKSSYKGNAIAKLGIWYFKKKIGNLFLLKDCIAISTIGNPRVFEKISKQFKIAYKREKDDELSNFLHHYFKENRKSEIALDNNFCFDPKNTGLTDISNSWEKSFKAKNDKINKLFIENDIIRIENEKVLHTGKLFVACGYRKPLKVKIPHKNLTRKISVLNKIKEYAH